MLSADLIYNPTTVEAFMATVKGIYTKVFDPSTNKNDAGESEFAHVKELSFLIAVNKRMMRELQIFAVHNMYVAIPLLQRRYCS